MDSGFTSHHAPQAQSPCRATKVMSTGERVVGRRLLVIDDDVRTANRLASMLEEDGFVVEVIADGRAALERLARDPAPDGILTDLIMPRAGGLAVLGEARRRWKDIPFVFITGHPHLLAGPRVGFYPEPIILTKPISYTELSETLRELFAE